MNVTTGNRSIWRVAHGREIDLTERGALMAIINVTPDSFSDGGLHDTTDRAISHALACVEAGADILDIGGESTRPGAAQVTPAEELARVVPVIEALVARTGALISIDTYRASTARAAIAAGAHIINDVHGLQREPEIASVAADTLAGLCIMHTGRGREKLADVIDDQVFFLRHSLEIARFAGVQPNAITLDPGFGFSKETVEDNVDLMVRFEELHQFGLPLLVGTSRKRFLGTLSGRDAAERDVATAATTVALRLKGAAVFRVHNVAINRDALVVADAMLAAQRRLAEGMKP
ncbi:dihydropteroate synthase [Rhizobium sp. CECT 9324]|uniref:dihydropteroate synthase n=1 Tax=Rhizobium sp. CECT 9324 TaxID=2845820 RepID=UPI001E580067|nr:dihydropteroate synthase [Rhizobium sp. CECT 9324]CAH0341135.1 Dihydropteroate synthase [Rhizobium sp. CECT 9324]